MSIAEFLRERIRDSGVSIGKLATLTGIRRATLYEFTQGKRPNLTLVNAEKLCQVLKLEIVQMEPPCLTPANEVPVVMGRPAIRK